MSIRTYKPEQIVNLLILDVLFRVVSCRNPWKDVAYPQFGPGADGLKDTFRTHGDFRNEHVR
jgi:hypothetical protein